MRSLPCCLERSHSNSNKFRVINRFGKKGAGGKEHKSMGGVSSGWFTHNRSGLNPNEIDLLKRNPGNMKEENGEVQAVLCFSGFCCII